MVLDSGQNPKADDPDVSKPEDPLLPQGASPSIQMAANSNSAGKPESNKGHHHGKVMFETSLKPVDHSPRDLFVQMDELEGEEWVEQSRWIKYEEVVQKEAERWGNPHVSTLTLHSLINLRQCLESGIMLLDITASDLSDVSSQVVEALRSKGGFSEEQLTSVTKVLFFKHKCATEVPSRFNVLRRRSTRTSCTISLQDKEAISHMSPSASRRDSIINCLKEGTEGTLTLVGSLDVLDQPVVAFVRIAEGVLMHNALEVPVPVRFIFIMLTPDPASTSIDCHEVGRSFSTLMSNPMFQTSCYKVEERKELLSSVNDFLEESVVLPPGDYESKNLLSINDIRDLCKRSQKRPHRSELDDDKTMIKKEEMKLEDAEDKEKERKKKYGDPLVRTGIPFGGVINDIRRRMPLFWDDIKDGFNLQCFSSILFIYFACLAPVVAIGGLYDALTDGLIGISEALVVTCVSSIIFALFAGCTGAVLMFDKAQYVYAEAHDIEYLPWRVWTSFWVALIAVIVAAFEGSMLVKYVTKFTKDVFSSLIAMIFLSEAIRNLIDIFKTNPVTNLEIHCNRPLEDSFPRTNVTGRFPRDDIQPNAALLSVILMTGTFVIAYYLKLFRNGKYLGRTVRRSLGDFGVPIAIAIMVILDYFLQDTVTKKLTVPVGLQVTDQTKRGWVISPMGTREDMPVWVPISALVPALLIYLLLFMEMQIVELLMQEKANKKGGGLHWDILLCCFINVFVAIFGGPFICAAVVRSVAHSSSLSVMSTTHAPGESAKVVGVIDQRLTSLCVSILIGVSVLLAPILQYIPFPVILGVFVYMAVSAIFGGIQFFDRIFLLFMPVKYHPEVSYVRRVKTWKMHMYTGIQFLGLATLWTIKSIEAIALLFPFGVVAMVPLRMALKYLYTPKELDALDGPNAGQKIKDDEPDFYEEAYSK